MSTEPRRLLIADGSHTIIDTILRAFPEEKGFLVKACSNGQQCLEAIHTFKPHLAILELTLPGIHGLEILKQIKAHPHTAGIGVIISTWRALKQDYQAALENGADYYLLKPFSQATITKLVGSFFEGTLKPAPFPFTGFQNIAEKDFYAPYISKDAPYIKFWGTRGSIPVAGADYLVFGGNTPCLEINTHDAMIIIDAGTGIRLLGAEILKSHHKEIHLFIGHTHWDHIMGFPFFSPVYAAKYEIHIYAAKGFGKRVEELFRGMLDHDYFPVKLDEMKARFTFHDLQENEPVQIKGVKIHYTYACHPGATFCFKIEKDDRCIGYATDNEMLVGYHGHPNLIDYNHPLLFPYRELLDFFLDCELMIHEAQYTPQEYRQKVGWGHSSIANATTLIRHCNIRNWIVTHHDPAATDVMLRSRLQIHYNVLADCDHQCFVDLAYDGLMIQL